MKRYHLIFFLSLCFVTAFSQKGKNGAGNIVGSTIVNAYTSLTIDAFTGNTSINVASAAGYGVGDLIYIIQMQGASVNSATSAATGTSSAGPFAPNHGRITNYNNAGNNEYAELASVAGNVITIDCPLINNYTAAGKVQIVKVPRYTTLNVTATGTITCPGWNGTTGGVIALEVDGNTTINPTGRIDATALGFRGGVLSTGAFFGAGAWSHNNPQEGAIKGEGIAGDVNTYLAVFQGKYCHGAIANAGGGANSNNSGGGGGANAGDTSLYTGTGNPDISVAGYVTAWNLESPGFAASSSSGGGRGGYTFANASISPLTNAPNNAAWGGDNRRSYGGMGGRPLNYNTGRLFCGGGGGAGDQNDGYGGAGANGGGIINIISYGTVSGGGQIISNGGNGFNTNTTGAAPFNNCNGRDGAGGAGGGGAIVINSIGLINALTVSAKGGDGGNQQMKSGFLGTTAMAYGPGGGGGGGYIGTTASAITTFVNGGINGIVQYLSGPNNCQINTLFPPNGATIGGSGVVTSTLLVVPTITACPDVTICVNNSANLTATTTAAAATIGWYTAIAGGLQLGTGSAFTTSVFTTPGTYTVFAGFCPQGIYRDPVVITVTNGPTLTPVSATVCAGQSGTISVSGATTYTWSTGSNSPTITATPLATTVYTVTGSVGTCTTATTATITVNASATISVNSSTICNGQSTTLTAGAALSYTWSTGANTSTISISPASTTIYTINATVAGGCIVTNTAAVTVNTTPTLSTINTTVCAGLPGFVSVSGATNYTWTTGSNSATITASPISTTSYSVVGANGTCTSSANATITVIANPIINVNSATVCAGQTGTISASGATTYTWNTGSNSATITATPAVTTTFTVNGTTGTCTSSATGTITVNAVGAIAVNSPTICSGQTATLTAGAAASYTWSTGANTSTIGVNPTSTTSYTINATLAGGCVATNTSVVTVNSSPTLSSVSATICSGQTGTVSASGAASYTWNTASNSPTITSAPLVTTVYTVTGANGTCTSSSTATINVNVTPTINVISTTICAGQTGTIIASGASSYTWNTGSNSATITATPATTTNYTVNGTTGTCTSSATGTITVNPVAPIAVNSSTICSGQSATLTAGPAPTYTWSTGANTQSVSVNPAVTTIYTINATIGGCISSNTSTVTVNATPTLAIVNTTVCTGQTGTISASGATNYTWSTGSNSSSISATPATTTTYTVTGANGTCTSSATASISVGAIGSIIVNSPTICIGQTATLIAGAAVSYTWSTGANTQSVSVNPAVTTVYTVIANTAGGCFVVGTSTVTVNSNPVLATTDATICVGQTGTISVSGATTYTWNTGATTTSITASPIVNTTYTVIGANGTCTTSATVSITINTSGTISVSSSTICSGQNAVLTAGAATSYTWSTGASTSSISVAPLATTVYTVNATLAGGCVVSNTATVTVNPNPTVTASTATICIGQSTTLTAAGAIAYLWNDGTATSTNVLSPLVTTAYTVTGTSGGCSSSVTTTVFVTPTPTLSAASVTVCAGQTATLTANGATTYTWDPTGLNVVSISFTDSPAATTVYTVLGATNGCTASTTASIVIGSNLSITVNTPTICSGQTATLSALSTATNYVWSNGGNTPTIFVNPVVNTSYTVTGTKGICTGSTVASVVVNTIPVVNVNANPICAGGTSTITASGAATYSWSNGSNNTSSITVTPLSNTSYTVIGELNTCTIATVYNLTITPSPTVTSVNATICNGGTATLTANGAANYTWLPSGTQSSSVTVNPSVNTTYTVIGDNGSCSSQTTVTVTVINGLIAPVSNANICQGQTATIGTTLNGTSYLWSNGATTQSITISPASTTSYSLLVVAGNCSYTANSMVTVVPTPTIQLSNASICLGQSATLTAAGATNGYTWNPGNINGNSIAVSPTVTTNYIVTSANGICPASATTQVIVNTKPVLVLSQTADLVCPNTPVIFSASGANIYEWYVNGNYHFGNPLTVSPTQNSTITLVGSNGTCSTIAGALLNVSDVVASFIPESNYVDYPGTLTFTNTSSGATSIAWDLGNGQTSTNSVTTASYEHPGKYLVALVAQNGMGCMDTTYYVIEAGCGKGDFYMPNTFTPNGDGLNDAYQILGGSCVTQFVGSVFDRWGTEIYKWKNIGDIWDGNYGGKQVEIGVYNYLITYTLYNGKVFNKTGHIAITR
ncbi:MAG: gliding motility-associated C-terminal domain-containing protein [Bacteroidetes bacterium]|nr:gliding motility-associated C-terminal domain-containing protein [Bacteroidota bacterium]